MLKSLYRTSLTVASALSRSRTFRVSSPRPCHVVASCVGICDPGQSRQRDGASLRPFPWTKPKRLIPLTGGHGPEHTTNGYPRPGETGLSVGLSMSSKAWTDPGQGPECPSKTSTLEHSTTPAARIARMSHVRRGCAPVWCAEWNQQQLGRPRVVALDISDTGCADDHPGQREE